MNNDTINGLRNGNADTVTNGSTHGNTNGRPNGSINANINGQTNGHSISNGITNGYTNWCANGSHRPDPTKPPALQTCLCDLLLSQDFKLTKVDQQACYAIYVNNLKVISRRYEPAFNSYRTTIKELERLGPAMRRELAEAKAGFQALLDEEIREINALEARVERHHPGSMADDDDDEM